MAASCGCCLRGVYESYDSYANLIKNFWSEELNGQIS